MTPRKRVVPMAADLRVRPVEAFERGQVLDMETSSGVPILVRIRGVRPLPTGSGLISVRELVGFERWWYRRRQAFWNGWVGRRMHRAMWRIREAIGG